MAVAGDRRDLASTRGANDVACKLVGVRCSAPRPGARRRRRARPRCVPPEHPPRQVGGHLLRRRARGERRQRTPAVDFPPPVHDATAFAEHPGGKFIEMAAGGDVETFGASPTNSSPKVQDALQRTRIGLLTPTDRTDADAEDPHADPVARPRTSYISRRTTRDGRRCRAPRTSRRPTRYTFATTRRCHRRQGAVLRAFVDGEHEVSMSVPEPRRSLRAQPSRRSYNALATAGRRRARQRPERLQGHAVRGHRLRDGGQRSGRARLPSCSPPCSCACNDRRQPAHHLEGADGYELDAGEDGARRRRRPPPRDAQNGDALAADHGFPCRAPPASLARAWSRPPRSG